MDIYNKSCDDDELIHVMSINEKHLADLLALARPHVKATVDRTNTRTAYESAIKLLAEIDAAITIVLEIEEKNDGH